MAVGATLASYIGGQVGSQSQPLLGGISRMASYGGNLILPNAALDINDYIRMFRSGFMGAQVLKAEARQLGFDLSGRPRADLKLMKLDANGLCIRNQKYMTEVYDILDKHILTNKQLPSNDEILVMLNRKLISMELARQLITFNCDGETAYANQVLAMRHQIPGPTDLIAFAVRDCFSPDIVRTFEYNKELPIDILPWMEKQGLGGKLGLPLPPNSTTTSGNDTRTEAQWFDLYWWSHWQLPSVGQGYEMLQRLYPDSRYGRSPYADADTTFSVENLELLQKANDFPTFWRKRLQAIAYNPLGRIDIKRLYVSNVLKEDNINHDVYHAYRAAGYNDLDANRLTTYVKKSAFKDIRNLSVQQLDKLWTMGAIGDTDVINGLQRLDFPDEHIGMHMSNLKLEAKAKQIEETLKLLHKAYLSGEYNQDQLASIFHTMGISEVAQERYIQTWNVEINTTHKYISVQKAVGLFKKGLVPEFALYNKLTNLRYAKLDADLIVNEAKQEIILEQAKALLVMAKQQSKQSESAQKQTEKALADSEKKAAKQKETTLKAMEKASSKDKSAFSERNIIAFYKAKHITPIQVENILAAKGWLPNTIKTWMATYTPVK
jgi:hypothetical protein